MAKRNKYYWDVHQIIEKINYLEDLLQKETNERKIELIQYDILLLKGHVNEFYEARLPLEIPKLFKCYEAIKEELEETSFIWSVFTEFNDIINNGLEDDITFSLEVPNMTLSKEDILSLTHDFYKSLNPFFYRNFMKHFNNRFNHVNFTYVPYENYAGFSLSMIYQNESYIEIVRNNTIEDVLTTIHEYEHVTSSSINPCHVGFNNRLFVEFDTLFMELIAQDYLRNVTNNRGIPIIRFNSILDYFSMSSDIYNLISLINVEKTTGNSFTSNKLLKDAALNECGIIPEELSILLHSVYTNYTHDNYLLDFILAIELYKIYKEDKDKALYILKHIIMLNNNSNEQYYSNIKRLGIVPNLSVQQFQKETDQELNRVLR